MDESRQVRFTKASRFLCRHRVGRDVAAGRIGVWSADAQAFETAGVRALGMDGVFVAVADDATANYWNPAGLTDVPFSAVLDVQRIDSRLGADPTHREGTSDLITFASLASPTLGLTYYRLRSWQVDQVVRNGIDGRDTASLTSLVTHHAGITLVRPFGPGRTVATVLKAVRGTAAVGFGDGRAPVGVLFDQTSELRGLSTIRLDLDAGVMIGVGAVRVALVWRNLREPAFAVSDNVTVSLGRQFRGASKRFARCRRGYRSERHG